MDLPARKFATRDLILFFLLDWNAADEDKEDNKLWEDDWDDDAVEEQFTRQLRYVASK